MKHKTSTRLACQSQSRLGGNDNKPSRLHYVVTEKITQPFKTRLPFVGLAAVISLSTLSASATTSPAAIDEVTAQWLNIEQQINTVQGEWKIESPRLQQQITLLNAEKKQLTALLSKSVVSDNSVDIHREQLLTEQTRLEQKQVQVNKAIAALVYTTDSISPMLPPVLLSQWQQEKSSGVGVGVGKNINTITSPNAAKTSANSTEKLQQALAQLTKLAAFNQRVSSHQGTIVNDDGQAMLVQQLFLGAGTAWFVSRDGLQAGWGQASLDGWQWHFDESIAADDIQRAIAMFHKQQPADWVSLPITLTSTVNTAGAF